MREFVRTTWQLWHWAMFTPSRLEQHKDDVLRTRFLRHYLILLTLFSLPLAGAIAIRGQLFDWLLLPLVFTLSYGIGMLFIQGGMHMPILVAVIYAGIGEIGRQKIVSTTLWVLQQEFPITDIAAGIGMLACTLLFTISIGQTVAKQGYVRVGTAVLIIGSALSVGAAMWLVNHNWFASFVVVIIVGFVLLTAPGSRGLIAEEPALPVAIRVVGTVVVIIVMALVIVIGSNVVVIIWGTVASLTLGIAGLIGTGVAAFYGKLTWRVFLTIVIPIAIVSGFLVEFVLGIVVAGLMVFFAITITVGSKDDLLLFETISRVGSIFVSVSLFFGIALLPVHMAFLAALLVGISSTPVLRWTGGVFIALALLLLTVEHHQWLAPLVGFVALVGYSRLVPSYPALVIMSLWRAALLSRASSTTIATWLRSLPPHIDELVWLPFPLPAHRQILAASFRTDAPFAMKTLDYMRASSSPGLRATVSYALPHIVAGQMVAVQTASDVIKTATPSHPFLPLLIPPFYQIQSVYYQPEFYEEAARAFPGEIGKMIPRLHSIARDVRVALEAGSMSLRERGLQRSLENLQVLGEQIKGMALKKHALQRWQPVIAQWEKVIQAEIIATRSLPQTSRQEMRQEKPRVNSPSLLDSIFGFFLGGQTTGTQQVREPQRNPWTEVINPFHTGNPLKDRHYLFKGRKQLSDHVYRQLLDPSRPMLVLYGPRRCGKTSFLLNLSRMLPSDVVPVFIDMQYPAKRQSNADLCYSLVDAIRDEISRAGIKVPQTQRSDFQYNPYLALGDWLENAVKRIDSRRILLCLDEFETLGSAIKQGRISEDILNQLRHLIQHHDQLNFLFSGVQVPEELGPNWSSYFISAHLIKILYLEEEDARDLLVHPDPKFDLDYTEEVIERILRMTRCHPYLLQLIGDGLVEQANKRHTRQVTESLLINAMALARQNGEVYFTDQWLHYTGTTPEEVAAGQSILLALANKQALPDIQEDATQAALQCLLRYHVIEQVGNRYRFEIPLIEHWVQEYARKD